MKFRNLFWGIILIFVGTLAILNNLDVIDFAWRKLWNLWPVFLMLWGISILPIKNGVRLGLVIVTLGFTMYYITSQAVYTESEYVTGRGWNNHSRDDDEDSDYFDEDSTYIYDSADRANFLIPYTEGLETATLKFDAVAGNYILKNSTKNLCTFKMTDSEMARYYKYSVKTSGDDAVVDIGTKHHVNLKLNHKNNGEGILRINQAPVWMMDIDAGAAAIDFNMEQFKVKKLTVDAGAADIDLKVGERYPDVKISIDAGASDITIRIPESSGCKVKMDTFLADKTLNGFNKVNGRYVTPNYEEADNTIYIDIDSAVSSLKIVRY